MTGTRTFALDGAECRIEPGWIVALLSTVPRSGTWYTFLFFETLARMLDPQHPTAASHGLQFYRPMKIAKYHTHTICPGFRQVASLSLLNAWSMLQNHYMEEAVVESNRFLLSPVENPEARVVFLYRNVFDHCVSSSQMINRQPPEKRRFPGEMTPPRHLRLLGAQQYVKQYLSFVEVHKRFPDNVMMVTYESLMRDPLTVFSDMLTFLGWPLLTRIEQDAVAHSVASISLPAMRDREAKAGYALSGRSLSEGGSHMTDGAVGKWRGLFSQEDIDYAESVFAPFGLSVRNLDLG